MTVSDATWLSKPPQVFDIVTCWFPERSDPKNPGPKLRPGLITAIYENPKTKERRYRVAYGTKHLKIHIRGHLDLIIQKAEHLEILKLKRATRFDFGLQAKVAWTAEWFGCWEGFNHPSISHLPQQYTGKAQARLAKNAALVKSASVAAFV